MNEYMNFINGEFIASSGSDRVSVTNPSTGATICSVPDSTQHDVDRALDAALKAQPAWAKQPASARGKVLRTIAAKIRERVEPLARVITEEQGKTLGLARVEVEFTADYLDYMAEWGRRIEGEIIESDRPGETILLFRQPIGVDWGNPAVEFSVFSHRAQGRAGAHHGQYHRDQAQRRDAPQRGEVLRDSCRARYSGRDNQRGARARSYGRTRAVGLAQNRHDQLHRQRRDGVGHHGGSRRERQKVNLELGGKAPAIVMADADINLAVQAIKSSRVINSGQVCNCAERVYVDRRVADEFAHKLAGAMSATHYGDPLQDESVAYGPLINEAGFNKVERLVGSAVKAGASVLTGGKRGKGEKGYYYEPTVITGCAQDMEIVRKEIFGPVIPMVQFNDLDEAIAMANDSEYGLTSSIYTRDLNVALRACQEIRFGETYINRENFEAMQGFHAGWRKSGIGGADGKHGLYEFTQTHMVYLQRQ